jgi:amino acid transporter
MSLDYLLNPVICTIWCSKAALNIFPQVPYATWAVFFAVLFTALNLRGIRATARTNEVLVIAMGIVVASFFVTALRYLSGTPVDYSQPFYDPATFSWANISTGTSLAVLTYIGFDGISTLSEEVHNPRRNILLATVLTCLIIGALSLAQVYLGQLIWPDFRTYPDADTAFVHVAGRAGGDWLFHAVNLTLLVATIGSGTGAQLAGARLLYGMGRDGVLPKSFFAFIEPKRRVPRNNVLFAGAVALTGAFLISYQLGAELLNFGAILGFMGVNLSAFVHYFVRGKRTLANMVLPLGGFTICFLLWIRLRWPALVAGLIWLAAGVIYTAIRTGGFRRPLTLSEIPEE